MKKQIYLLYDFLSEAGGLERELINHGKFLRESGYEVKILTCHLDKKILRQLPFDGLKIETLPKLKTKIESLNMALCLLGLNKIKRYNPDLFVSYSASMNFLIRNKVTKKADFMNHYPNFLYLRGRDKIDWARATPGIKRKVALILAWILGFYLKRLDIALVRKNLLIFANSRFTKKRVDSIYKTNSTLSYPPLDEHFKPSNHIPKDKFIYSAGRIVPDKKYEWLIESMAYVKNKLPLHISGSINNSYRRKLELLARTKNVNLKFLGRVDTKDLIDNYSSAEVFVFPTPKEDFGLVPAESISCGTPVVVWGDGGGPTEQIISGVNGFHARPYDLKDFAAKIDQVIDTNLKKKNRKKILESSEKFKSKTVKKEFIKAIEQII